MINVHDNYWIPSNGYKYITNGEVYTDSIYLGARDSISNWYDTNDEPLLSEEEITNDDALNILLGGELE